MCPQTRHLRHKPGQIKDFYERVRFPYEGFLITEEDLSHVKKAITSKKILTLIVKGSSSSNTSNPLCIHNLYGSPCDLYLDGSKLPVNWVKAVVFVEYSGFLHQLAL